MKKLLFMMSLLVLTCYQTLHSQNPTIQLNWANKVGGSSIEKATSVAVKSNGDVVTVGYFQGTVDFNPGTGTFTLASAGGFDGFVQILDASGSFVNAFRLGSTGSDVINSVHIDGSNVIYIGGHFNGAVDFDLGTGSSVLTNTIQSAFISVYSSSYAHAWTKMITGTGTSYVNDITSDISGNVLTTGSMAVGIFDFDPGAGVSGYTVTTGTQAYFVHRLSNIGNFSWAKGSNGGGGTEGNSIITNSNNDVIVGGVFAGSVYMDFPSVNYGSAGLKDGFLLKLTSTGVYSTSMRFGTAHNDAVNVVRVDNANNIYVGGSYSATMDFDFGTGTTNLTPVTSINNYSDAFIAKYTNTGSFLFANSSNLNNTNGIDQSVGLSVDATQNAFVASEYNSNTATPGLKISKYLTAGTFSFGRTINGLSTTALKVDGSGNLYAVGAFSTTVDFNPAQYFTQNLSATSTGDAFTAKFSECTTPTATVTINGLNSICTASTTTSYSIAPIASVTGYTWSNTAGLAGTSTTNIVSLTNGSTNGTGLISVVGYNNCGNSPTFTLQVVSSPNTSVTVSANNSSVCAGTPVTLSGNGTTSFTWSSGATTASTVVSPTITTTYTLIGANGQCTNTKTISININAAPTITVNNGAICLGKSFTITPSGAVSYTYAGGSSVVTPTANTTYSVSGTGTNGCNGFAISSVTVNALPTLTVNSGTICSGNSFTMNPTGGVTYTYSSGSNVVSPSITTTYTVMGTNAQNCSNSITSLLTVNATPTLNVAGGSVCPGNSFTFNPTGANSYTYSGGQVVTPTTTTNYTISGTSAQGCLASPVVATVVYTNAVSVSISSQSTVCYGATINLTANGASSYTWSNGATTSVISPTLSVNTTYSVIGASGSCTNTAIKSITVNTLPTVMASTSNTLLCVGQTATLTAMGANTYTWSTTETTMNIAVSPTATIGYTVTGTDVNGCMNVGTVQQNVSTCTGINSISETLNGFEVYPNPNNGQFNIEVSTTTNIELVDVLGKTILKQQLEVGKHNINISNLSDGVYFVKMNTKTIRVIKN